MDLFGIGPMELVVILVLALIVFGPRKLPELGRGLGKALYEFRKTMNDMSSELTSAVEDVSSRTRGALQSPEELPPPATPEDKKGDT